MPSENQEWAPVSGNELQRQAGDTIALERGRLHDSMEQTAGPELRGGTHTTNTPHATTAPTAPAAPTAPSASASAPSTVPPTTHHIDASGHDEHGHDAHGHGATESEITSVWEHMKYVFKPRDGQTRGQEFLNLGTALRKNIITPSAKLGAVGLTAAAGTGIAEWPVIGKIPYLPAIAASIKSGVLSATTFLKMNTGTAATNSLLAYLPNAAGPLAVAGAGLWGIGKANEWLTGRPKSGINVFKTMWNGVRAPVDLPVAMAEKTWAEVNHGYKYVFGDKAHGKPGVIMRSLNWMGRTVKKNARASVVAAAAAGLLAPFTGGSSLILGATGFVGTKIAERNGLVGGAPTADAHAAGDGGHH